MAAHLASLGAQVVIASRKADVLRATAEELNAALAAAHAPGPAAPHGLTPAAGVGTPGHIHWTPLDVRDAGAISAALDFAASATGSPATLVVNNAAGNFISPFTRLSPNAIASVLDIVLKGTALVSAEAGRRMIAHGQGGVMLNILATYAPTGSAYVAASAAAKGGVYALTKSLAAEWGGKHGIRVCGIAPGPIETEGAFSRLDPSGKFRGAMRDRLPARRLGEAGELANLAAYVLSPYAAWMTGAVLDLDGGEKVGLSGEFNALDRVTEAEWDGLEAAIRAGKGKGKTGE